MILGIAAFVIIGITLEDEAGISFATTYRIACGGACLFFIWQLGLDYPGERWPRIALMVAFLVNVSMFFTPVFDRPASRGEIIMFALPDAIICLAARIFSYSVTDEHQRAVRQQLVLGLVLAVAFCAVLFFFASIRPATVR